MTIESLRDGQPAHEDADSLRAMVREENRRGGRLQLRANTRYPDDGPWMLTGSDSRGRRTRAIGTEQFLCTMLRSWPSFAAG